MPRQHQSSPPASASGGAKSHPPTHKWPNVLVGLATFIVATACFNFIFMTKTISRGAQDGYLVARNAELEERLRRMEAHLSASDKAKLQFTPDANDANVEGKDAPVEESDDADSEDDDDTDDEASSDSQLSPLQRKANSINSYWWPSVKDGGGLLTKIYNAQHPSDCASPSTKFLVWRSKKDNEHDTRGLTAWAHAFTSHLLHALTDGDTFRQHQASRVLIFDDKLWPMAKGCVNGPETRSCYFEPMTSCKMADVDPMQEGNSTVLAKAKQEYDRNVRTVYLSNQLWFRLTGQKYAWTTLPGHDRDHSGIALTAATMAYYFRPQPWLQKELDKRIRRSIPADLDPDRTVGVPIRRSDKCHGHNVTGSAKGELDCPPLSLYLDGVKQFLLFDPLIENVIVTSEDKSACDEFLQLMKKELPSLRVVLNVGDVQQGTGSGSKLESYVEGAANANVVASALTSLHLHLRARYFMITSKSTWTSTISVMARVYGFASDIFVLDIGRNKNAFSAYARSGCYDSGAKLHRDGTYVEEN
ncbi:hypothetical protein ACHAXT_009576 [Thalassiosira profunda]